MNEKLLVTIFYFLFTSNHQKNIKFIMVKVY
jgi:hypothetical protein